MKINKLFLILILTGTGYSSLLFSNCGEEIPSSDVSYDDFKSCDEYYETYFIGETKATGNDSKDKQDALANLSNSISSYITTTYTKEFHKEVVKSIDGQSKNIVSEFVTTLKTQSGSLESESEGAFLGSTFRKLIDGKGTAYWCVFKNKEEFKEEGDEINNLILGRAQENFDEYRFNSDDYTRYYNLFSAYLLVNCISGLSVGGDIELLKEVITLKGKITLEFNTYLNALSFEATQKLVNFTPNIPNRRKITVNVNIETSDTQKEFPYPSKAAFFISTGEFDGTQNEKITNKMFQFKIPTIQSKKTNQKIHFYPDIPISREGKIVDDLIDPKIKNQIDILLSDLKKRAKKGEFGNINLKAGKIGLSFNEITKATFRGVSIILPGRDKKKTINKFIKDEFNNYGMIDYDENSQYKIDFDIRTNKEDEEIIIYDHNGKESLIIDYKQDAYKEAKIMEAAWKKSSGKFSKIIQDYIKYEYNNLTKVTINYVLGKGIQLKYYINEKAEPILPGRDNKSTGTFKYDKGELTKIQLLYNKKVYMDIDTQENIYHSLLFDNEVVELSEIVDKHLVSKGFKDQNKDLISGTMVRFKEKEVTYYFTIPQTYLDFGKKFNITHRENPGFLKRFKNETDLSENMSANGSFTQKNTIAGELDFEGYGFTILKSLGGAKKIPGPLPIQSDPMIKPSYNKHINLEFSKVKGKTLDYLIPGLSNFRLQNADKLPRFRGVLKMITFVALSALASNEYNIYQEHLDDYRYYQNEYNTAVDTNQEEMNDLYNQAMNSYDLMSEHHRNQNIAMLGLAGLYTYNIIEFRWKINGKWWKK